MWLYPSASAAGSPNCSSQAGSEMQKHLFSLISFCLLQTALINYSLPMLPIIVLHTATPAALPPSSFALDHFLAPLEICSPKFLCSENTKIRSPCTKEFLHTHDSQRNQMCSVACDSHGYLDAQLDKCIYQCQVMKRKSLKRHLAKIPHRQ